MCHNFSKNYTRRDFLTKTSLGLGALSFAALADPLHILGRSPLNDPIQEMAAKGIVGSPHFLPKVKRVIYLFQSGAPSQQDIFDYKPLLNEMNGKELPESVRGETRLTGMSSGQASFPLAGSLFNFKQHGQSGAWMSDLMPYTSKIVDELCFVKSMHTDAINHDPAITFMQSGSPFAGRPSIGSWVSYGLGSDNENLPAFVVLLTKGKTGQPLYSRLWGNGFLPSEHQGVQFRAGKNPVLYLNNPPGVSPESRRAQLDHLRDLQEMQYDVFEDPTIQARVSQYEMAFRMQTSVPEVMDTSTEPESTYKLYGEDARIPGTYAANCLLA